MYVTTDGELYNTLPDHHSNNIIIILLRSLLCNIHIHIHIYIYIYIYCIHIYILSRVGVNWPLSQFFKDLCGSFHAHYYSLAKTCGRFHAHCSKSRRGSFAEHGIVRLYSNALKITTETYKCHHAYHEHRCF